MFLNEGTLRGSKLDVYVFLKILKSCTDSAITSYKCKYAVQGMLLNVDPNVLGLGKAIRKVMNFGKINGKFSAVHQDLQKIGIFRVEVTDEGFIFKTKGLFYKPIKLF